LQAPHHCKLRYPPGGPQCDFWALNRVQNPLKWKLGKQTLTFEIPRWTQNGPRLPNSLKMAPKLTANVSQNQWFWDTFSMNDAMLSDNSSITKNKWSNTNQIMPTSTKKTHTTQIGLGGMRRRPGKFFMLAQWLHLSGLGPLLHSGLFKIFVLGSCYQSYLHIIWGSFPKTPVNLTPGALTLGCELQFVHHFRGICSCIEKCALEDPISHFRAQETSKHLKSFGSWMLVMNINQNRCTIVRNR